MSACALENLHFNINIIKTACFQAFQFTPDASISETRLSQDPMGVKTPLDRAALPNSGSFGVNFLFTASSKDNGLIFMSLSPHLLVNANKFSRNATDTAFFSSEKMQCLLHNLFVRDRGPWAPPPCGAAAPNLAALRRIEKVLWFKTKRL